MTTRERAALGASGVVLVVALVALWFGLVPGASPEACEARVRQAVARQEVVGATLPECEGVDQGEGERIFNRIIGDELAKAGLDEPGEKS